MYRALRIAVVVPAFNEARLLPRTLGSMPDFVDHVVVVDDASADDTARCATACPDPRVELVAHARNGGVGAAIVSGYRRALALGADAIAVMAADAQMDPADLPALLDALVDEGADYVKGDRLAFPGASRMMPPLRYAGTLVLGWLTRLPSGFAELSDSQCGYTVIRRELLERLPLDALYPRYGFPNDMLNRVGEAGGMLAQRPVRPVYADELSGLRIRRVIVPIARILVGGMWRRLATAPAGRPRVGRDGLVLWLIAALLLGMLAGAMVDPLAADETSPDATGAQLEQAVERVREAARVIDEHFVEPVEPGELIYHAAYGAVATLDINSKFLPPSDYQVWHARIHGQNTGPGFEVRRRGGKLVVTAVSPDSEAARSGMSDGDELLALDGHELAGSSVSQARERLRGAEGSRVTVRFRSQRTSETLEVELTRAKVRAVPVMAHLLPGGVAWVEVRAFQEGATRDVADALESLADQHGATLSGVVIDLRNNLGGLLDEGLELADLFLPRGLVIVSLESRGETLKVHKTWTEQKIDLPMVVVVNGRSASASELFAAALQEHGRAQLVGWTTYGKGSVQSTYPLDDGSGLKITTSRYMTPRHRAIDGIGIDPDVRVESDDPRNRVELDDAIVDDALQTALDTLLAEQMTLEPAASTAAGE